jgi:hypothetical protein
MAAPPLAPLVPAPPDPLVSFLAPSAWYFRGADALRLTSFNAAAGVVLALEGRFLTVEGEIKPFRFAHTPNTDRTTKSDIFLMGAGWLLDVQVRASAGTPRVGQCFVVVEVVRGLTSVAEALGVLVQGYVTDSQRRGWPGTLVENTLASRGVVRSITGTDPAANVEISETVPTGARWKLRGVLFTLVTDANVANREVALTIDDGATVVARIPSGFTQTATLTTLYSLFVLAPRNAVAQDTTKNAPLPDLDLQGGYRIRTVTTARQVTDNFGPPQLLVEEWIEP